MSGVKPEITRCLVQQLSQFEALVMNAHMQSAVRNYERLTKTTTPDNVHTMQIFHQCSGKAEIRQNPPMINRLPCSFANSEVHFASVSIRLQPFLDLSRCLKQCTSRKMHILQKPAA
jgi:hypothetical protein